MNTNAQQVLISLVANGSSLDTEVVKETEKALNVYCALNRRYGWIPKSVLKPNAARSYNGGGAARIEAYDLAPWFIRKVMASPDNTTRLALGLVCY